MEGRTDRRQKCTYGVSPTGGHIARGRRGVASGELPNPWSPLGWARFRAPGQGIISSSQPSPPVATHPYDFVSPVTSSSLLRFCTVLHALHHPRHPRPHFPSNNTTRRAEDLHPEPFATTARIAAPLNRRVYFQPSRSPDDHLLSVITVTISPRKDPSNLSKSRSPTTSSRPWLYPGLDMFLFFTR